MKKDKKNSFNTPEGYFESFNDRLMDKIKAEEAHENGGIIPKTDGFAVPDGYFDQVESSILSKTSRKEVKVIPLISNRNFYYSVAAIAAIFILIFNITGNPTSEPITFDDLANAEIEAYLENTEFEMTSYEIAAVVSLEEVELNDILVDDLEDDIILEYLDEYVDDIEELNLEYPDYE
ncbi:hypothetical protein GUA46_09545 [Muricauda sp. HICW]|uniref:Uncharacterized protein n=1 Tax=Flagellimonas chongwuensis TaxID=2697365 RepID=A0A850NMN5_9FLAO|nr:hypothetical protein [Allomuricauda chongwuensis]NVN18587.1 hypothetical protein [Allomuricauda chongwuensis]